MEKNNAWNIRRLVNESYPIDPASQLIILKIVGFQQSQDSKFRSY